jgi:hypothetical protein
MHISYIVYSDMGNLKLGEKNWKGGELPEDCLSIISYIASFSVFILASVFIYYKATSLLGVLLLYLVNFIYSILVLKDIFTSAKSSTNSLISFVIIATLVLNVTSSTMIIMTFRKLRVTYLKNDESIQLSDKSRNLISVYLTMWIVTTAMIWVLFAFYFIEPIEKPFFNYMFIGQELSPLFMFLGFMIKTVFSLSSLGMSGYMVYLAKTFSDIKSKTINA